MMVEQTYQLCLLTVSTFKKQEIVTEGIATHGSITDMCKIYDSISEQIHLEDRLCAYPWTIAPFRNLASFELQQVGKGKSAYNKHNFDLRVLKSKSGKKYFDAH